MDERTPIAELLGIAIERIQYWESKAKDIGLNSFTCRAAKTLELSYTRIYEHLSQAQKYLIIDE